LRPDRAILRRRGRTYAAVIVFLLGFAVLLVGTLHFFLVPVMKAAQHADAEHRRRLGAMAWLMMTVLLVYLICGLILAFRVGRFFLPRPGEPRVRTRHTDIWSEAGRRLQVDENDNPDGQ
jgi:hypothetical protein